MRRRACAQAARRPGEAKQEMAEFTKVAPPPTPYTYTCPYAYTCPYPYPYP